MRHVTPRPIRLRFYDEGLRVTVARGVGSKIECPTCGQSKRSRSWAELRAWLRLHVSEEHPSK